MEEEAPFTDFRFSSPAVTETGHFFEFCFTYSFTVFAPLLQKRLSESQGPAPART